MQSKTFPRLAIATAITAVCTPVTAQEASDDQQLAQLDPVVVTATRTPQTVDETISSVSVISRQEIERLQPDSVPDLLQRTQGVEISRNGSRGGNASIFVRGTQADQTVILVDGIRVNTATTGQASLEALPLDNIERIEVVRGPRSSIYGADAIGGVIQIFTREGRGPHFSVGAGSHDLRKVSAGYGTQGEDGSFSVNLSGETTDGFDGQENDSVDEPDDDGFESLNFNARGDRQLSDRVRIHGSALVNFSENEFDGSFQNESRDRQISVNTGVNWDVTRNWTSSVDLSATSNRSRNFLNEDTKRNTLETDREEFRWQNDFDLSASVLATVGIDLREEDVGDSVFRDGSDFGEESRTTRAIFAQHQWTGDRASFEQSIRHEDIDDFGRETTGSIGFGYELTPQVSTFASAGNAFKAPTFNELFFPGFGNPDLDAERSRSIEVGLRGQSSAVAWEASVYQTDIDDLILNVNPETGDFLLPTNIQDAQIRGIEAGASHEGEFWSASLNLGYKEPKDEDGDRQLPRRAEETMNASVTRDFNRWDIGFDVTARGERFDDVENEVELGGYATVDLRASFQPTPDWTIRGNVRNALDKNYTLAEGYETDGRNYFVEATYRPE